MPSVTIFYVYEHWRPDKDVCFWVGKGHGNRAYDFRRNRHYNSVVKKLSRLGMCVEVRLVQSGLEEIAAFLLEKDRISFWRSNGVRLTNYTDGGEGVAGLKHSDATRQKIREKRKSQKVHHSAETRAKISAARKGVLKGIKNPAHSKRLKGRKLAEYHKANISAGLMGRQHSDITRAKIGAANAGKNRSTETRERLSIAHLGNVPSAETRIKMSSAGIKRWKSLEARAQQSRAVKKSFTPEVRAKLSKIMTRRFSSPEARAKLCEYAKRRWDREKSLSP